MYLLYPDLSCSSLTIFFFNWRIIFAFWFSWTPVAVVELSLVVVRRGYSSLWCMRFSLQWILLLQSRGSRCEGSVVVGHGLCCPESCGIFPDQGLNPCLLHWQAEFYLLYYQGSPCFLFCVMILKLLVPVSYEDTYEYIKCPPR